MKTIKYNKLVRDKIPDVIESSGKIYATHIADEREFKAQLSKKLQEEVSEFLAEPSIEEIADILEVIYAICDNYKFNREEIEKFRIKKLQNRGAFKHKIILEEVKE